MARGFGVLSRDHLRTAAADGVITAQALVALGVPESTSITDAGTADRGSALHRASSS